MSDRTTRDGSTATGAWMGEGLRVLGDRYVISSCLGSGGCGVVYEAHDPMLDRPVAIKILGAGRDPSCGPLLAARLLREARAASHVNHPNVIRIYDVGEADGVVFVAMERLRGGDLRTWLRREPRHWSEILRMFVAAARGLEAVHDAGLVHRDFKPSNVFVTVEGRVCLLDFGLSKPHGGGPSTESQGLGGGAPQLGPERAMVTLTGPGDVLGTPLYMAPEQHEGARVGPKADQFALCASMYEALCGRPPFPGDTAARLHEAKARGVLVPAPRGRAPRALWAVLRRGLRVEPRSRWPDVETLRRALEGCGRPRGRLRGLALGAAIGLGSVGALEAASPQGRDGSGVEVVFGGAPWVPEASLERARVLLQRSRELEVEGQAAAAIEAARWARTLARRGGDSSLALEASLQLTRLGSRGLPPEEEASAYEELFFEAVEHERSLEAAIAASTLVYVHGVMLSRPREARRWSEHARTHLERLQPGAQLASLEHNTGVALRHAGQLDEARHHLERAVGLGRRFGRPSDRAKSEIDLAATLHALGDSAQAHRLARGALATLEREHGLDDPVLVPALQMVSEGQMAAGQWGRAAETLDRALRLSAESEEGSVLIRVTTLVRSALAEARLGHDRRARARVDEAQSLLADEGLDATTQAALLIELALPLAELEDHERVVATLPASIGELETAGVWLGTIRIEGHLRLARSRLALGDRHEARRRVELARAALGRAVIEPDAEQAALELRIRSLLVAIDGCDGAEDGGPELDARLQSIPQPERAELRFFWARCETRPDSLHQARRALAELSSSSPAARALAQRIEDWIGRRS
ncbi:MAG: serine/threonine protein kinase [Myxococcales bacterium]|nr:serine/threonine protein kinase [Myxococcales bacterium]